MRVCATIALSLYLRPRGLEFAVMGVAAAFILGELTGWLVLAGAYLGPGRRLLAELKGRPRRGLNPWAAWPPASLPWPSRQLWPPSSGR